MHGHTELHRADRVEIYDPKRNRRGAVYVVGGSTSAGASHSAAGSRRVDLFMP